MPLSLRRGVVTNVLERHEGLARLEVDGVTCVAYPGLTGPVALGDDVVVNTQARELGLGSGGFDVLYLNLTRGLGHAPAPAAHVVKLPYTPVQAAARHAEEDAELPESLDGMPVVCCSLHSQVTPGCAALAGLRVAYVQLEGGALPVELSDTVRLLRERHRGLSHHTRAVLDLCLGDVLIADEAHEEGWWEACAGLPLEHMGRGPDEDPAFFAAAYAAGRLARELIG